MSAQEVRWDEKDPADVDDFTLDFSNELGTATLVNVTWTAAPAGLVIGAVTTVSPRSTVRLSAGTSGVDYTVTATATLSDSRTLRRSARLYVVHL